jgi:hypothetical protein
MWTRIQWSALLVVTLAGSLPAEAYLPQLTAVEEQFADAIRRNPTDDVPLCSLARSLLLRREYSPALECAQVLVDRHPRSIYYRLLSAECTAGMGWKDRTAADLEQLLHEAPTDPAVRNSLTALGVLVTPSKPVAEVGQLRAALARDLCYRYQIHVRQGVEARSLRIGQRPLLTLADSAAQLSDLVASGDLDFPWDEPSGKGRFVTGQNQSIYCSFHGHAPSVVGRPGQEPRVDAGVEPSAACLEQALKNPDRATIAQLVQRAYQRRDTALAARVMAHLNVLEQPEDQLLVLSDLARLFRIAPGLSERCSVPAAWITSPYKQIGRRALNLAWVLGSAPPLTASLTAQMMDGVAHGEVPLTLFRCALKSLTPEETKALAVELATLPIGLVPGPIRAVAELRDPAVLAALARRLDGLGSMERDVVRSALEIALGEDAGDSSSLWLKRIQAGGSLH